MDEKSKHVFHGSLKLANDSDTPSIFRKGYLVLQHLCGFWAVHLYRESNHKAFYATKWDQKHVTKIQYKNNKTPLAEIMLHDGKTLHIFGMDPMMDTVKKLQDAREKKLDHPGYNKHSSSQSSLFSSVGKSPHTKSTTSPSKLECSKLEFYGSWMILGGGVVAELDKGRLELFYSSGKQCWNVQLFYEKDPHTVVKWIPWTEEHVDDIKTIGPLGSVNLKKDNGILDLRGMEPMKTTIQILKDALEGTLPTGLENAAKSPENTPDRTDKPPKRSPDYPKKTLGIRRTPKFDRNMTLKRDKDVIRESPMLKWRPPKKINLEDLASEHAASDNVDPVSKEDTEIMGNVMKQQESSPTGLADILDWSNQDSPPDRNNKKSYLDSHDTSFGVDKVERRDHKRAAEDSIDLCGDDAKRVRKKSVHVRSSRPHFSDSSDMDVEENASSSQDDEIAFLSIGDNEKQQSSSSASCGSFLQRAKEKSIMSQTLAPRPSINFYGSSRAQTYSSYKFKSARPRSHFSAKRLEELGQHKPHKKTLSPARPAPDSNLPFSSPYAKKDSNLPRGFSNLGNTCFLNACLQCLFSVPGFVQSLMHIKKYLRTNEYMSFVLSSLHSAKQSLGTKSEEEKALLLRMRSLVSTAFPRGNQHDVHEFLLYVLDRLDEEARSLAEENEAPNPVSEFLGTIDQGIMCLNCGHFRSRQEDFVVLSLDVSSSSSSGSTLTNRLGHYFEDEDVSYTCEKCENKSAKLTRQFASLPRVLVLHLKRFTQTMESHDKLIGDVTITRCLKLKPLCSEDTTLPNAIKKPCDTSMAKSLTNSLPEAENKENQFPVLEDKPKKSLAEQEEEELKRALELSLHPDSEDEDLKQALAASRADMDAEYEIPAAELAAAEKENEIPDQGPLVYQLSAVISHLGKSATSGHYISDVYDEKLKKWVSYSDSSSHYMTMGELCLRRRHSGYLFFYTLQQNS